MLNMMISNIAIEFHRTNPNTKVLALHPGTVSTRPSEPFSKNVAPEKLFSIDSSVNCLLKVIENTEKKPRGVSMPGTAKKYLGNISVWKQ